MHASLLHSDVLLLDIQSTGASPARGHLLEMAWCRVSAHALAAGLAPDVTSFLVALPDGARLPRRIAALTGICEEDLAEAADPREVHDAWRATVQGLAADAGAPVAVAHFARFEKAFVADLQARHDAGGASLDWLCTHEIVCRLLPDLPHRGLRAVAGRLGHVVAEGKRARDHVAATAVVWSGLVQRLERDAGVSTIDGLREWLASTAPQRNVGRAFAMDRASRLAVPDAPGVYRMLGPRGQLLYVGKATSLRRRVNSYFQKRRHPAPRTAEMLAQVFDVGVTEAGSALEAALLENDLIKEHAPPYNVALRERAEPVAFVDAELRHVSDAPRNASDLGPVPRRELLDAWTALAALLGGCAHDDTEILLRRALGLPDDAPLDDDVAREGLGAFLGVHPDLSGPAPVRRRLLGAGARSWKAYRAALAAAREAGEDAAEEEDAASDAETEEEDTPSEREAWVPATPEQVARVLEGVVRHGALLVRRGRWLVRLAECALVWRPAGRSAPDLRLVEISGARIVRSADVPAGTAAPTPPRHGRPSLARAGDIDAAAYDRLRILTTELRRIVAADGRVELRLTPHHSLDRAALARRLFWV